MYWILILWWISLLLLIYDEWNLIECTNQVTDDSVAGLLIATIAATTTATFHTEIDIEIHVFVLCYLYNINKEGIYYNKRIF